MKINLKGGGFKVIADDGAEAQAVLGEMGLAGLVKKLENKKAKPEEVQHLLAYLLRKHLENGII